MCYKTQTSSKFKYLILFIKISKEIMNMRENYDEKIEIDGNEMREIEVWDAITGSIGGLL